MFHSRFARGTSLLVFVSIFALLLGACSSTSPSPSVPLSNEAVIEGNSGQQPEVGDAESSGENDQDSVDEGMQADIERWRAPIGVTVILSVSCEGLIQTAEKRASGEIDGMEAFGELLAAGFFVQGAGEGLASWTPGDGQGEYQGGLQDHVEGIKAVVGSWVDDEIDSSEANDLLIPLCDDIEATFEDILKDAERDGVTSADVEALITELGDSLGELDEDASTPDEDEVEHEAATPEHGMGRFNPYPPGAIVNVPNWDIQVLDVIRGEVAWAAIQATNMFNDEPREGMEYISIKVYAKSVYEDEDEHSISSFDFNLTGDRLIRYAPASVVDPEPALDATIYTGGDTEGWISFEVADNEGNLILIFDEMANWDDDDRLRYIAIDEGASFNIPAELSQIQSNEFGKSRLDPAPFGETLITRAWEITILETVRGDQAWSLIEKASMYNDLPDEGMEYILTKVRVRYIGDNEHAESIYNWAFGSTGDESVVYDVPGVFEPNPPLDVSLFPGGVFEGWVTLQAAKGESGMKLIFETPFDFSGEKRFLSLEP